MLVQPDPVPEPAELDTLTPLCDEAEFTELIDELVADEAPRLFAVVQEYGERVDGRIAAWGMAFEDCAKVVGVDRSQHLSRRSPECAARAFKRRPHITTRVVWVSPTAEGSASAETSGQFDPAQGG